MPSEKSVLIVDDDTSILEALELTFNSYGYRTKSLASAKDVDSVITEFKPDIIILDVLLSGIDGKEICKRLKADSETRKIPVIMVSAHPDIARSAHICGANDFLEKPFDLDNLINKVKKLA